MSQNDDIYNGGVWEYDYTVSRRDTDEKRKGSVNMKTLAIIGCGRIARLAHFPALAKMEGVRVKYACDLILEKAEKMKEDFPFIEQVITDYQVPIQRY